MERISIGELLYGICEAGRSASGGRKIDIVEKLTDAVEIIGNRDAIEKVFQGIPRNAIENTPDEGKIEVKTRVENMRLVAQVVDSGTGITPENQKLIFTGFFRTQDTEHYSTKTPYAFNAGGSGADLLRAKVFSERYGFDITFEISRCAFIPEDTDECPGSISRCKRGRSQCVSSGTVFSLAIPSISIENMD